MRNVEQISSPFSYPHFSNGSFGAAHLLWAEKLSCLSKLFLVKDEKGFFSQRHQKRTISISEGTWKITENIFHHIFDTGLLSVRVVGFVKYILQFFT